MSTCYVEGCIRQAAAKGLCKLHHQRFRNGIDLNLPLRYHQIRPKGWIHNGYRWMSLPGGREVMEHRYVMETILGRPLRSDEIVHHIDGNKLNNSPKNLELTTNPEHTSHHRTHRMPCVVCGKDDLHGSHGLCSTHHQRALKFCNEFGIPIPRLRSGADVLFMGIAWSTDSEGVRDRLASLRIEEVF